MKEIITFTILGFWFCFGAWILKRSLKSEEEVFVIWGVVIGVGFMVIVSCCLIDYLGVL